MSVIKKIQGDYKIENLVNPNYDPNDPDNSSRNPELYPTELKTSLFTINGDVKVLGDTILEDLIETTVKVPMVLLNSEHDDDGDESIQTIPDTPSTNPVQGDLPIAGLEINRGTLDGTDATARRVNVQIRYNDTGADRSGTPTDEGVWEASDNGIDYYPLDSTEIENDPDPHLGGDLIVNDFAIKGVVDEPLGGTGDVVIKSDGDLILTADTNNTLVGAIKAESPLSIIVQTTDAVYNPGYHTVYAKLIGSGGTGLYVTNNQKSEELVSRSKAIVFGLIF